MIRDFTKENFIREYEEKMIELFGISIDTAHITEQYLTLGEVIREYISLHWKESKDENRMSQEKQVFYFSMEFLMGRLFTNNLMNLQIYDIVKEGLEELGIDINGLEDLETDAGLGNGGLGRLAACFMDSIASEGYIGHGNCIRYEYGFFKQLIEDYKQKEVPDLWLKLGNVWEIKKPKHTVQVHFGGKVHQYVNEHGKIKIELRNSQVVNAVPYDVPIVGYNRKLTNTLRLWSAEPAEESLNRDHTQYIKEVREICNSLYPDDSTEEGKLLRIKQQYFFVSAGVHSIIRQHLKNYPNLDNFSEKVAIQLNDTHPVLAIPELMRILMDDYEYAWDQAWDITINTMAYTNHTVLSEALEKWPIAYIQKLLPRVYMVIQEIQNRFEYNLHHKYNRPEILPNVSILKEGQIHMAHLAIVGSHSVNGVAALHTKILKEEVMKDFYDIMPHKFNNKTNGITHRRWLMYSNPQLTKLLDDTIGEGWKENPKELKKLLTYADDMGIKESFLNVKQKRKEILAAYIKKTCDVEIDVNSIFDVQAKRLHAYKRQLLNVLHIIYLYNRIKENPEYTMYPRTFIFAAKAAPSYVFAKKVIKLINCLANKVNNDPDVSKYMKVVFIPNYGVSIAEILMNAADVSEQISTAGKEASGTGNMKFMMNGALTLGTLDGANVEIVEKVGFDNAEIFGLRAEEVAQLKYENAYNVWDIYNSDPEIHKVMDSLLSDEFSGIDRDFAAIFEEVMNKNDEYLVLKDFWAYHQAQHNVEERYKNRSEWATMCLKNIACSSYFSSDRTIDEYVKDIWFLPKTNF
ncbi:starch phosphorylase [Breznakia sp. PF5-3]|uniref:glycogen/starch/alpha-glucan phosphorylase n=1 Tax=unclassified Breznakia TaxID=2623764 RepID=UPI0024067A4E|nr:MULTISPECIES: glycogen/starch/alpha-glucan phosphorylase [unclassified Breznakia]MDF9824800.1 starch phosphorylase [Breznakia sp. PM6-1]MDF9835744.1 starch phosphorylase [Breznakia sp. PF5-3]MDF9837830.1 starch phosphorylase [Breznakia sp. PFB2-8]MDF9859799.1 starch phosphorylase [Breznakia sp. PH5-24]